MGQHGGSVNTLERGRHQMFPSVLSAVAVAASALPPLPAETTEVEAGLETCVIDHGNWFITTRIDSNTGSRRSVEIDGESQQRTVRARVQPRPGAAPEEIDMRVHESPVNPPSVVAAAAHLVDDELVLGRVVDGQPMAYPIRYLAPYEVINDVVGSTALAPTW